MSSIANTVRLVIEPLPPVRNRKTMASPVIDGRFGDVNARLGQELCHMVAQGDPLVWVESRVPVTGCRWRGCIVNGASLSIVPGIEAIMAAVASDDNTSKVAYGADRLPWAVKVERVSLDAKSQALDAEPDTDAAEDHSQLRETF